MEIINKSIEELKPYKNNAKLHPQKQIDQIAESIKAFGFNVPILIDSENMIIAGHGRYFAAKKLKLDIIPAILIDHLTEAQKRAFIIADNKLNLNTSFDMDILKAEFEAMQEELDDLTLTGFTQEEIDELFPKKANDKNYLTDPDDIPEPPETPVCRLGDIWQLNNHRLMCGDSTDEESVKVLMNGEKADMVFMDPPYLIETQGGNQCRVSKSLKKLGENIEFISNFEPKKTLNILPLIFEKNKMNAYIFCNKALLIDYLVFARDSGYSYNILIWKKPNPIPIGDSHRPDIEYLLLFRKNAIWNNGLKNINYSRCLEFSRESGLHPTMKPVILIENEIYISSNTNSLIIDLFLGSGSTLIAAEKTNRTCYGMELEPKYCDVIIKRWEDFTGQKAVHVDTNKTFLQLKAMREANND